jgi:hypothetical protein
VVLFFIPVDHADFVTRFAMLGEVDKPARLPKRSISSPPDLIADPKEEYPATALRNTWNAAPSMKIVSDFEQSLKKYPPIPPGTRDRYTPKMTTIPRRSFCPCPARLLELALLKKV